MPEAPNQDDNLAAGAAYFARIMGEHGWSEESVNTTPPPGPDPQRFAAVNVHPSAQQAHLVAGLAVAVILTGGKVKDLRLGHTNFSTDDESADTPWWIRHRTDGADLPFVWFAALRAAAMWLCWYEDADYYDAMHLAWIDNTGVPSRKGIADKYESRVDELAACFGPAAYERAWEGKWDLELERFDLGVCEVAEMLIDGQPLTHADVEAAVDRCRRD
jgi:hypothetical protein